MTTLVTTREQRRRKLGVDCPDRICWKNWEAGEEYARKLVIKNVEGRAQTISYRLPERKTTFLTPYPEPVMLSSGMSFELEIRFCPTEVVEINDLLEIAVEGRGSFVVYLECLTPFAKMSVPKSYDFEFCPVSVTASTEKKIENTGTVPLDFYWEVPPPFSIVPPSGSLAPGESMRVTMYFTPREACAVMCQAVCKMENLDEVIAIMRLSGIGKYPHVRFAYEDPAVLGVPTPVTIPGEKGTKPATLASGSKDGLSGLPILPLASSSAQLDFKDVIAGSSPTTEFFLENPSPVSAQVTLKRHDDALTCPFTVAPASCTIPRGGRQRFRITYKAKDAGTLHRNRFEWKALAGNTISLEVRGAVVGPAVKVSTSHMNFGDVNLEQMPPEKELTRYVQLKNYSDVETHFQLLSTSPGAVFYCEPCVGSIEAKGSVKVKVCFRPTSAINYLRRLVILVENAASALYVDVFGSAYDAYSRPLPFDLAQVEAFNLRMERGLGLCTPDELEVIATAVLRERNPVTEEDMVTQNVWRSVAQDANNSTSGTFLQKRTGRLPYAQLLPDEAAPPTRPFSLETSTLVFGGHNASTQSVSVANSSEAMATAVWCLPVGSPYTVTPGQQDIAPGGMAVFQVMYQGNAYAAGGNEFGAAASSLAFHAQYLECYVNYKQMRSFRLVNENSFTPPHCLTLQCCQERKNPEAKLAVGAVGGGGGASLAALTKLESSLALPPSRVGDSSYQVVAIENTSDVVLLYEVRDIVVHDMSEKVCDDVTVVVTAQDGTTMTTTPAASASSGAVVMAARQHQKIQMMEDSAEVFRCFPPSGLLHPHQRVLMLIEFRPHTLARYEAEATIAFNNNNEDTAVMLLKGESCIPRLTLEDSKRKLTFRPTCITGETRREMRLLNPTAIPIAFQFCPCQELLSVVRFDPPSGVLEAGQRLVAAAYFSPEQPRVYEGRVAMVLRDDRERPSVPIWQCLARYCGASSSSTDKADAEMMMTHEYVMTIAAVGEGMHGMVEVEPTVLDCGDIAGLEPQTVSLTLYNSGMCEVEYEVRVMVRAEPAEWRHVTVPPKLRNYTGILPARSHAAVLVTVQPSAGLSEYVLYAMICGIGTNIRDVASPATAEEAMQHPHCVLTIRGTRPAIQVTDVRSLTQQRSHLWRQLAINQINEQLASAVMPIDVEKASFAFPQYIQGLVPVAMDLGVGHPMMPTMSATLMIENAGDCPADFSFWAPIDNDVHGETWFVEDEELKDIQRVIDSGIIELTPRSGTIAVGSSATVTIRYRFSTVGVHTLPMLLRVSDGKKVLLVLEGRTLPPKMNAVALHHPSTYELMAVALGDVEPPMQAITIDNPFNREVEYSVDVEALRELAEQNYGFPILQCVTPTGVLAPRSVAQLLWYFRPLEAKEYVMQVPVHVTDGESYLLTFVGTGYHPRKTTTAAIRAAIASSFLALPAAPSLCLTPALPVTLFLDVCYLGAVPYFSLHRRTCVLENHHHAHTYSFQWDARHTYGDHTVTVQPENGLLRPGERVECRVVLYSGSTSQMVEWPAMCHVTNETMYARETQAQEEVDRGEMESTRGAGGEERNQLDIDSPAPGTGPTGPFKRTTCTKMYNTSTARKGRRPVTEIPLESLGVAALAARTAAARRRLAEQGNSDEDGALASTGGVAGEGSAVIWNALELLVQARVMPLEEYERVYGMEAVQHTYFPALNMFTDPMSGLCDAYPQRRNITMEDIGFVRDVMDEMLRSIVALPRVQSAFTEPMVRGLVRYRDLVPAPKTKTDKLKRRKDKKKPRAAGEGAVGYVSNVLEEVLEDLLFGVVGAIADAASHGGA